MDIALVNVDQDFLSRVRVLGPHSENHQRDASLTHTRRTSIPKSPRKVFKSMPSNAVSTPAAPVSTVKLGVDGAVPNSTSLCIPAPMQTGPCLLMPTPSFAAFDKAKLESEAERKVKKKRRQGMGWLKPHTRTRPAAAPESLMLAMPSFVALAMSNSTASFASRVSLWHGRRGKPKADNDAQAGVTTSAAATAPISTQPESQGAVEATTMTSCPSPTEPDLSRGSPHLSSSLPTVLVTPSHDESLVGLPKGLLDTLSELEVIAEEVKQLPIPESPEHPLNGVMASVVPMSSGSGESGGRTLQKKSSLERADPSSDKACVASPITRVSRLPRTSRIGLGRAVSSPSGNAGTPARSAIPYIARRIFSEPADKLEWTFMPTPLPVKTAANLSANAPSKVLVASTKAPVAPTLRLKTASDSAARSSDAVFRKPYVFSGPIVRGVSPTTSGAGASVVSAPAHTTKIPAIPKMKSTIKPRLSEPVSVTSSALRKVSPAVPASRIARKARHSALPGRVG